MYVTYVMNNRTLVYMPTTKWKMGADGLQSMHFVYKLEIDRMVAGDAFGLHLTRLQAIANYEALLSAGQNDD